jgi:dTDP-4-dehydrorhamnose reductase
VYSRYGANFVKTMLRLGEERPELRIVYDQVGAPTSAADLAQAITDLILSGKAAKHPGIYNYSNEGVTSWYDFAKTIFELSDISCQVHPIESKDYPTPASRPHYSLLNKAKFKTTFGFAIPHWKESLASCLETMNIYRIPY